MKKTLLVLLPLVFLMLVGCAATNKKMSWDEAKKQRSKYAEKARKKLPVYAVTPEVLQQNSFPNMPEDLIKHAREIEPGWIGYYYYKNSEVEIDNQGDVITFSVDVTLSGPSAEGGTYVESTSGPITGKITAINEIKRKGLLFLHCGDTLETAVPGVWTIFNDDFAFLLFDYELPDDFSPFRSEEEIGNNKNLLIRLTEQHNGMLTREAVKTWYRSSMEPIYTIVKTVDQGYVKWNEEKQKYCLVEPRQ
jgi:hypothetical protein